LLGLSLLRRQILAAERAGFDRIYVEPMAGTDLSRPLAGTRAQIASARDTASAGKSIVRISAHLLLSVEWLRALRENPSADPSGPGVFEIRGAQDLPRAERWLLDGLVKETEGFMSRHVERKISLAISRRLAATRVTPNAMTIVSVGVGLAGAAFFLSQHPAMQFAGALLFLAHSILDGCDGELARLKFQVSRLGGVLDFWGDNVVHCAVFAAIALGWWRQSGEIQPLLFGGAAIAGTLLSAGFVYFQTMSNASNASKASHARESREGPLFASVARTGDTRISRMADFLARRDFIYLVVILAAFGKANWFLILAAVGAPLFFLVLVGLALGQRNPRRSYS
jgi:1L-myo-inositol 1-phosphate cytidylyltransferase / CDP-L-myo-inositol myo-inositolphosphotransferase